MRRAMGLWAVLGLGCSASLDLDSPADGGPPDAGDAAPVDAAALDEQPADASAPDGLPPDAAPGCEDPDGDGHGPGCPAGPDCDPDEPLAWTGAEERCDGVDNDCDGQVDDPWPSLGDACEAGLGACASPGVFACAASGAGVFCDAEAGGGGVETCNDRDDDCDGVADEDVPDCCNAGQTRPCGIEVGACTAGEQVCTPARTWGACSGQGPAEERCSGQDDDCDGRTDEDVLNACGACGPVPDEACNGDDDDCDGRTDEGLLNACGACGPVPDEACNGADDDCDGRTDEGVLNACGACGPLPDEACNGADDDCDGRTDEGLLNACGACGPLPDEVCNGADDDCDGRTDEGVLNACGACGAVPAEVCNGEDDDCDGVADEAGCRAYYLAPGANAWSTPRELNQGPFIGDTAVTAAAATLEGGATLWLFGRDAFWRYDADQGRWLGTWPRATFSADLAADPWGAYAVPAWWRRSRGEDTTSAVFYVGHGDQATVFEVPVGELAARTVQVLDLAAVWAAQPNSPDPAAGRASVWDARNTRRFWLGSSARQCGEGPIRIAPAFAVLAADTFHMFDPDHCAEWLRRSQADRMPALILDNAPPAGRISAWVHVERADAGQGAEYVFLSP